MGRPAQGGTNDVIEPTTGERLTITVLADATDRSLVTGRRLRMPAAAPFASFALLTLTCRSAHAHVKWFADWSVLMCPPRNPLRVLGAPLWQAFFVAAIVGMALLAWVDFRLSTRAGGFLSAARTRLQAVHDAVMPHAMTMLRLGLSAYWLMVSLTLATPVYLTPELAGPPWVCWLQMACALAVLSRSTCWLAGLGLIAMYGMATVQHGWFHLLDYPLFLVVGIILLLPGRGRHEVDALGLDLLRWSAAVTLLWGGIEKFEFPEWSFPMMQATPMLSLGLASETAMYVYGFGEVAMAFALLRFGVGSQVAALLLLLVFVAAVPLFGWVDFVGHSAIIVALALLALTRPRTPLIQRAGARNALMHGMGFPAVLLGLLGLYFGLHSLYLGSVVPEPAAESQARAERARVRATQANPSPGPSGN